MIVTCVYINLKPDKIDEFIAATRINHLETVKEPGNLRVDIIQQAEDSSKFILYEAFESDAASLNHKTTGHYLRWRDQVADYMADPRIGVRYNIIEPKDREKW